MIGTSRRDVLLVEESRQRWRDFFYYLCFMKRFVGLLSVIFLLAACYRPAIETRHGTSLLSELVTIDTLMQTRPDSALSLLLDTPMDDPYYQLLLSEAFYKNDSTQLNRLELQAAMAYFDSVDYPFLSARCHYINGVGYYEMDSVVPACREYLRALDIMEEHFEEKELVGDKAKFMALTYTHLCGLFSDQYLNEQAIYFGNFSLPYYYRFNPEPWHVAWIMDEIGSQYDMTGQMDSARFYYQKAEGILKDTLSLLYRDIESHLAYMEYEVSGNTSLSIHRLQQLLVQAESEKEYLSRCLVMGELYYHERTMDSAKYYLNKAFDSSNIKSIVILSAQHLQEICLLSGDTIASNKFTVFLSQQANPGDNQAYIHSQLLKLCQEFVQNQKEKNYLQQRKKIMNWGKTMFWVLITTAVSFIAISLFKKNQLKEERYNNKIQKSAIMGRLKKSNEKLKELNKQIVNQQIRDSKTSEQFAASFEEEPICRFILQQVKEGQFKSNVGYKVYKKYALEKDHLLALRKASDYHFNHYTSRLIKAYPNLHNSDIDYCCLCLLGLSNADLAALMQRAYNTINERNNKLKRILGSETILSTTLLDFAKGF